MWSCLCALSYYYMVAAWGGYVFIINIIPIYTVIMMVGGRYSSRLYIAYSVFYTLGSLMAMTVPFVGFNVINQAECAASHGVFAAIQVFAFITYLNTVVDAKVLRGLFTTLAFALVAAVAFGLISMQLLGKIQWSGRSLTLLDPTYASKYIPIIASVSEHQPTTWTSFFFDLHILVPLAPVGLFVMFSNITDGGVFVILYGTLAWYFAGVMVRLMLTLAPIACVLAAIGLSSILTRFSAIIKEHKMFTGTAVANPKSAHTLSPSLALLVLGGSVMLLMMFSYHATYVSSMAYSSPSIVIDAGRTADGRRVMYDDYREAYFWLRQNTHPGQCLINILHSNSNCSFLCLWHSPLSLSLTPFVPLSHSLSLCPSPSVHPSHTCSFSSSIYPLISSPINFTISLSHPLSIHLSHFLLTSPFHFLVLYLSIYLISY